MQGIKAWARANPGRVDEMLNINPRYVFFNENPGNSDGPIGKLGVPLTAERSIAVDPGYIPLGAPVFLSTTKPLSTEPSRSWSSRRTWARPSVAPCAPTTTSATATRQATWPAA